MFRNVWTGLMAALVLVAAPASRAADSVRARVQGGTLVGTVTDGVKAFKGIPYAAPPIGKLHWELPQPVVPWSGERAADDFGFSCKQPVPLRNVLQGSRGAQLSDDCLTLNVWAPQGAREAPV